MIPGQEQLKNIAAFVPDTTILSVGVAGIGASAEAVPADHQRFLYFQNFWNLGGESIVSVYESRAGVLTQKWVQRLTTNQNVQIPQAGPNGNAIAVFRASTFVRLQISGGAGTTSGIGIDFLVLDKPGGQ